MIIYTRVLNVTYFFNNTHLFFQQLTENLKSLAFRYFGAEGTVEEKDQQGPLKGGGSLPNPRDGEAKDNVSIYTTAPDLSNLQP